MINPRNLVILAPLLITSIMCAEILPAQTAIERVSEREVSAANYSSGNYRYMYQHLKPVAVLQTYRTTSPVAYDDYHKFNHVEGEIICNMNHQVELLNM